MKILYNFFLLFFFIGLNLSARADYSINVKQIDNVVSQAKESSIEDFANLIALNQNQHKEVLMQKSPFVAWVLTYTLLGFHRLYLGTSSGTFFAYFFTLGGFLILDIVDYAVLLAAMLDHRSIDKYVDNPHFFMWNE